MDSRLDLFALLGLRVGEAHVIRNAGGLATDDAIRSLALSQHLLGTRSIRVVQHTRCGLMSTDDEAFAAKIGRPVPWPLGAFADLDENVRRTVATIRTSPYLVATGDVTGFAYDVDTGELREVV